MKLNLCGPQASAWLLLWVVACQPTTSRVNPDAPKPAYITTRMEVRNEQYRSTVNVPVSIGLADIARQINAQVNGVIYEGTATDEANPTIPVQTRIEKRAPIALRAGIVNGDSLFYLTVPLRIRAKAALTVLGLTHTEETTFEIDLRFASRFSIDPDWSVSTHTRAEGYDWVTKPSVRLLGLNIPLAGFVGGLIDKNLGGLTANLDKQVRQQVDLRTPVLQAWNGMREPYLISELYQTWLQVVPQRIVATPLRFENGRIRASIGIEGFTLTQTGTKPVVRPAVTLPDLRIVKAVPGQFRVGILSEISYAEAARLTAQQFVGQTFTFREGKNSVTIKALELYGQSEFLIVKAGLIGSITGDIYLKGKPYYDAATKTILLKDLTYDFDTKNVLAKAANWLLHGTFARTLQQQLTFPVGNHTDAIRQAVQAQLRHQTLAKGVTLTGQLDTLSPDQVYLTPKAMVAVVFATGQVSVTVDGLE
jgi:Domain of unknown function (DUF4403)